MILRFAAPYPYLLEKIEFCFHLSPIFWWLQSKIRTAKKSKHCKNDGGQLRPRSVKEKEILCEIQRFVV